MKKNVRPRQGDAIRAFILRNVPDHPGDIVGVAVRNFGISRQAVGRHVRSLVQQGRLLAEGNTSSRRYSLVTLIDETIHVPLVHLKEHEVWRDHVEGLLGNVAQNVHYIWNYAFSEMVNNAIDHSGGTTLTVSVKRDAFQAQMLILDDGVGIFRKIKDECNLEDERHAVLELAKGKLTTDPERHTGEGIFFTSRMMDDFSILSGDVFFSHKGDEEIDWIDEANKPDTGTTVVMSLENDSTRTTQDVFDRFVADKEDYGFNKTVVPVRLARHGAEQLVSRSQAKRLLARVDRFSVVIFDFRDVDTVGQAFADEIFRVFERSHPDITLIAVRTTEEIVRMIRRARSVPV